ncbi:High-affinity glucose transporter RGT2 [Fusarium oxysporum f. sp. albedinis]|nr:High-affinity glucose transporter RGT2 [Fusarium oxysporum f. sp. albedinis]
MSTKHLGSPELHDGGGATSSCAGCSRLWPREPLLVTRTFEKVVNQWSVCCVLAGLHGGGGGELVSSRLTTFGTEISRVQNKAGRSCFEAYKHASCISSAMPRLLPAN